MRYVTLMDRKPHDEWIFGSCSKGIRKYLVHTVEPRFIAEIFAEDDPAGILDPLSYVLPDGRSLACIEFCGVPPTENTMLELVS